MVKTRKHTASFYAEETPNPETMKFVSDVLLYPGKSADFQTAGSASASPLAKQLFAFPFVKSVFIASNFITITKSFELENWTDLIPDIRQFLTNYISEGGKVIDDIELSKRKEESSNTILDNDGDVVTRIKKLLEEYVQPAVEMDGGAIRFISFEQGVVRLDMQGACSGCPSSMVTLKSGVERIMKKRIPEVTKVISDNCPE